MQSIRAQRLRKIMVVQGEVGGKKEFNVKVPSNLHEILRKSKSQKIEELAVQDLTKRMLNDDFNTIQAYDIKSADLNLDKEKKKNSFKSMHNMYDLQTMKLNKLYKKKQKTSLEQDIRKQLSKDPDKLMLLSEIYEQLEEPENEIVLKKKSKVGIEESLNTGQEDHQEQDESTIITEWTKKLKQSKKKNNNKQQGIRKSMRAQTELIRSVPSSETSSQKSIKDKFQHAFKKVKEIKELQGDMSVNKQIQQYLSRPSEIVQFSQQENAYHNNFDYSIEGVQRFYNLLIKQTLEFRSEAEKAKFYKKQTHTIVQKLADKKKQDDQTLKEKEENAQQMRIESHDIHERLSQIKILLEQLSQELEQMQKNPKQLSRSQMINSVMTQAQKIKELEKDIQILMESRAAYKAKLMYNKRTLDKLDQEIFTGRKESKHLKQCLIQFYYYLLRNGQDVRSSGIAWIISKLTIMGERVYIKSMPDFLDQKCKEYLLQKAVLLYDIDQLEKEQSESFKQYKAESADNSLMQAQKNLNQSSINQESLEMSSLPSIFPSDSNKLSAIDLAQARADATKTSRNNYSLDKLGPITLGLSAEHIEALEAMLINLNKVNVPVTNGTLIYKETQKKIHTKIRGNTNQNQIQDASYMDSSSILKEEAIKNYDISNQQLNRIRQKLNALDDEQVHRIAKEFDFKSYGKRFNIDPITVIACLVGGSRCDREIVKYGLKKIQLM